jgi:hypothetical protein
MLRNRTYLFGLGTGFIIAAVVLQLVYEADKVSFAETEESQAPIGLERLQEEAERLGYALYEQDKPLFTAEEVENRIQEALKKEPPQQKRSYAFSIGSGTDVSTIAYMLVEMGLIDDWRAFMDEIKSRGLADKMQARYYIFEEKPDMKRLITELTSTK